MFWFVLSALLACGVVGYVFYERVISPTAGIPGPFIASLTRLWITRLSLSGNTHKVVPELHKRHGHLVRIGPNEVSITDPDAIKAIYRHGTKFRKSSWYEVWQGRRKFDLFPERDERLHGQQRRLVAHAYSLENLRTLEKYVDDALAVFFKRVDEIRLQGSIDMGKWAQLLAFEIIGEVTFSKRFGFLEIGEDDGSFKQIEGALRSAAWIGQMPWLYWSHDYLSPYIGNHLAITARHGSLRQFAVKEVQARKDRGSDHQDLLGKLYATHQEKPKEFDETAVMSMATSNIFAGSDTTAISMRAVIYYLLKFPECKARLVEEIDSKQKAGGLSFPVKLAEAERMDYLQAVIREALRCHPAVGMSLPRVVPEGGMSAGGRFLPQGTVVGANPWAVHTLREVFGEDADTFRPERWLNADTADMDRLYFPFGQGSRICLGKNISLMEISKLIPSLFARYHVNFADGFSDWSITTWWFAIQRGLYVQLNPR